MPTPPYLPEINYGYDDGFTTIISGFIGSSIGCIFILLLSYFDLKKQKTKR